MKTKFSTFTLSQVCNLDRTIEVLDSQMDQFVLAEKLGFSTVWFAEHIFSFLGVVASSQVLASAIARTTKTIRIGTAASILPFNHPLRTASDFAVIDCMSKGRLNFGIARGFQPVEFASLGLDITKSREMYQEALEIILKAWEGKPFTYEGQFWQFTNPTTVYPGIVQKPHPPIFVAVQTRDSFVDAARRGFHIMMGAVFACRANPLHWIDELASNLDAYDQACLDSGYDPAKMSRALMIPCHVADTSELAHRRYEPCVDWSLTANAARRAELGAVQQVQFDFRYKDMRASGGLAVGDVRECAAILKNLRKRLRLTEIILEFNKGELEPALAEQSMRVFMNDVAPLVNDASVLVPA